MNRINRLKKAEEAVRTVLQFRDAVNRRDFAAMEGLLSLDCRLHSPSKEIGTIAGRNAVLQYWKALFERCPDVRWEIEEMIGWGDRCVLCRRSRLFDVENAGGRGLDLFRIKNGLIVEHDAYEKIGTRMNGER